MNQPGTASGRLNQEQLDEIVRRLVHALAPRRIYLFGSHAYGEPHENSDVDLMLIVRGRVPPVSVCYRKGHASLRGLFVPVELHFASAAGFERRRQAKGSLEHEISEQGQLIYASE
jgi:predicted nucleotidyltransferase